MMRGFLLLSILWRRLDARCMSQPVDAGRPAAMFATVFRQAQAAIDIVLLIA
jgi:hypothetical protein